MATLMYCKVCERNARGAKSKTDWLVVIFCVVITFGFFWLFYIIWHICKKEDKCPFCGTEMVAARKGQDHGDRKPILTLFTQPTKDGSCLDKRALRKGEIKDGSSLKEKALREGNLKESIMGTLHFTNIGEVILNEAKKELNSPIIKLINERENVEWEVSISSNDLKIYLHFRKYKGRMPDAKNSYIKVDFNGDINKIRAIRDKILGIEGETIYNMDGWDEFIKVTGITKDEVENAWKKDILEASPTEDESGSVELELSGIDIPTQIKKLAELKDQGILTPGEFEEKKKELLAKM